MSVAFHPSQALLAAYADGSLLSTPGLPVAAHLGVCGACAARVQALEESAGAALLAEPGTAMAPGALERALEAIKTTPAQPPPKPAQGVPAAISGIRLGPRIPFPKGVWLTPIRASRRDGWRAILVHAPANVPLPVHDHSGPEHTYVLEGAYCDRGARYGPGDFTTADADVREHRLIVTSEGPCTCLIASQGPVLCRPPLSFIAPFIGL